MATVSHKSDESLTEFLQNNREKIRLVDFWAEGCDICSEDEVLEEIANQNKEWLRIYRANVADEEKTVADLGVAGVPVLVLYLTEKTEPVVPYLLESTKSAIESFIGNHKPSPNGGPKPSQKAAGLASKDSSDDERIRKEAWKNAKAKVLNQYRGQVPPELLDRMQEYFEKAMNPTS